MGEKTPDDLFREEEMSEDELAEVLGYRPEEKKRVEETIEEETIEEEGLSVWIVKKEDSVVEEGSENSFSDVEQIRGKLIDLNEEEAVLTAEMEIGVQDLIEFWSADSEIWIPPLTASVRQAERNPDGSQIFRLHFIDPPLKELRAAIEALKTEEETKEGKTTEPVTSPQEGEKASLQQPLAQLSLEDIDQMFEYLAEITRKDGLLALEAAVECAEDDFISSGISLIAEGTDQELVKDILETWMESLLDMQRKKYRKLIEGTLALQRGFNSREVRRIMSVIF